LDKQSRGGFQSFLFGMRIGQCWLAEHHKNDLHAGRGEGPITDIVLNIRRAWLTCYVDRQARSFEVCISCRIKGGEVQCPTMLCQSTSDVRSDEKRLDSPFGAGKLIFDQANGGEITYVLDLSDKRYARLLF
jgi:hypothetical protein